MALLFFLFAISAILAQSSAASTAGAPVTECQNMQAGLSGKVADSANPKKYYVCDSNLGYSFSCPANQPSPSGTEDYVYDATLQACVPESRSKVIKECPPTPTGFTCPNTNVGTTCSVLKCTAPKAPDRKTDKLMCKVVNQIATWVSAEGYPTIPACVDPCANVTRDCQCGTCDTTTDPASCKCADGFTGKTCSARSVVCNLDCSASKKQGICTLSVVDSSKQPTVKSCTKPTPTCTCNPGFEGTDCASKVSCGAPTTTNGQVTTTSPSYSFKDTLDVKCNQGFYISGKSQITTTTTLTCGADKTWTPAFSCVKVDCGTPTRTGGTIPTPKDTTFGGTATLTCNTGYSISLGTSTATLTCLVSGKWGTATCTPHDCNSYTLPSGVSATVADAPTNGGKTFGKLQRVTCSQGYVIDKTTSNYADVKCEIAGWTVVAPATAISCVKKTCDAPTKPSSPTGASDVGVINYVNPTTAPTTFYYNNKIKLQCKSGYKLAGKSGIVEQTCDYSGWTPVVSSPACQVLKCNVAFQTGFKDGTVTLDKGDNIGTVATITCSTGYVLSTDPSKTSGTTTCSANSDSTDTIWNPTPPTCVKKTCSTISPTVSNGSWDKTTGSYQDEATLTCNKNYFPYPATGGKVTCGADGNWSPTPSQCQEKACSAITLTGGKVYVNGKETTTGTIVKIGNTITFSCDAGYNISPTGGVSLTCDDKNTASESGSYSGPAPTCENINDCVDSSGKAIDCGQGTCVDGISTYTCQCQAGYKNSGDAKSACSVQTNPCSSNPCLNGAECQTNAAYTADSNVYEYKCLCKTPTQFSGYNCKKDTTADLPTSCVAGNTGAALSDPRSCKKYVECVFGKAQETACVTGNVFDSTKGTCVLPAQAAKESFCTMNYD